MFGYFGVGKLPYISRIHTAYIGEDSSTLGTTSMFREEMVLFVNVPKNAAHL